MTRLAWLHDGPIRGTIVVWTLGLAAHVSLDLLTGLVARWFQFGDHRGVNPEVFRQGDITMYRYIPPDFIAWWSFLWDHRGADPGAFWLRYTYGAWICTCIGIPGGYVNLQHVEMCTDNHAGLQSIIQHIKYKSERACVIPWWSYLEKHSGVVLQRLNWKLSLGIFLNPRVG